MPVTLAERPAGDSMTTQRRSEISVDTGKGVISLPCSHLSLGEFESLLREVLEGETKARLIKLHMYGNLDWKPGEISYFELKRQADFAKWFEGLDCITMALVNGELKNQAVEVALLCDLLFVTKDTLFVLDEGFVPCMGAVQRSVYSMGLSCAKGLFLLGQMRGEELFVSGAANAVFENREEMESYVADLEGEMLKRSFTAQAMTKRILDATLGNALEAGLALEREMFGVAFTTHDRYEGIKAFFEKREANFKGEVES